MRRAYHYLLSLRIIAQSFVAINQFPMQMDSRLLSWQQETALDSSFWCSFSTPMLQLMSIFMQSPQCFFSYSCRPSSESSLPFIFFSSSFSILSANDLALRISQRALPWLPMSLRMAALLRQVATMSYWWWLGSESRSCCSRSREKLTALSAVTQCLLFLSTQARLLKVSILRRVRVFPLTRSAVSGSITRSTAFAMNLALEQLSAWSFMFSIAILFIFCTSPTISSFTSQGTFNCGSRSFRRRVRWTSFSSQRTHQIELFSSLSLYFSTTVQRQCKICESLILGLSSLSLGSSLGRECSSRVAPQATSIEYRISKSLFLPLQHQADVLNYGYLPLLVGLCFFQQLLGGFLSDSPRKEDSLQVESIKVAVSILVEDAKAFDNLVKEGFLVEPPEWKGVYCEMRIKNYRKSIEPLRSSSTSVVKTSSSSRVGLCPRDLRTVFSSQVRAGVPCC